MAGQRPAARSGEETAAGGQRAHSLCQSGAVALAEAFDAVIYHGDSDQLRELCEQVAARDGAIVSVQGFARGETNLLLERLYIERSLSVNTAAAGGNASLMTIG